MQELIAITSNEQGSLLVDSVDFAAGLDIQHKNLLETIKAHRQAIEADFGLIAFETRKVEGKGRPETFALLTEDQALFVGTLSRNSTRVIAFKSVLVRSFAEARKRIEPAPAPAATEQMMLQLMQQQQQLMSSQQLMLEQLRADVESIKQTGHRPASRNWRMPAAPPHLNSGPALLRQQISRKINDYCAYHSAQQTEAYNYLYKRMMDVYGVNVYRLIRMGRESIMDAIERYGHLERLYSLLVAELTYSEE